MKFNRDIFKSDNFWTKQWKYNLYIVYINAFIQAYFSSYQNIQKSENVKIFSCKL